jgi:hypothetical protein
MQIRRGTAGDLPAILNIYADARKFMRESGNPTQWKESYPTPEQIEQDVLPEGHGYICEDGGDVAAVFYYQVGNDPTYDNIEGEWQNDEPYGVVHRIAVKRGTHGVGAFCLNWAFRQCGNLKIDTHTDNAPMRRLLGKLGFIYCGTVWVHDGTETRMAFQKVR